MASEEIVVKVPCTVCGAPILPRTAEKNGGLCMRCKDGWVACSGCGERAARGGPGVAAPLCPRCEERARGTRIDDFIRAHGGGDCALLARFFHLEERFRKEGRGGVPGLDLIDPPERGESDSTPRNTVAFADLGVDAIHVSLVAWRGRVSDASAVVLTVPQGGGRPIEHNFLLGQNLHEFLCLGARAGFSPLGDLAYEWDEAVEELESGQPSRGEQQVALGEFREELQLQPWPDVGKRLRELQELRGTVLRF